MSFAGDVGLSIRSEQVLVPSLLLPIGDRLLRMQAKVVTQVNVVAVSLAAKTRPSTDGGTGSRSGR